MFREHHNLLISYNSEMAEPDADQDPVCPESQTETWIRMRTSNQLCLRMWMNEQNGGK